MVAAVVTASDGIKTDKEPVDIHDHGVVHQFQADALPSQLERHHRPTPSPYAVLQLHGCSICREEGSAVPPRRLRAFRDNVPMPGVKDINALGEILGSLLQERPGLGRDWLSRASVKETQRRRTSRHERSRSTFESIRDNSAT